MTTITSIILFLLVMAGAWWLSGYDSSVTGEHPSADVIRRTLRCGVTAVLLLLTTINPYFAIFIFVLIGVIWASCGAEFFARRFQKIVDPDDDREFDPKEPDRNMDQLGQLVRQGRVAEALDLCKKFEKSGEISPLTLEATRHHIYQDTLKSIETSPVLKEIRRLNDLGKFEEAESGLKQILATQPINWAAMLLLMRIYVKGLARPAKALAYVQLDDKQSHLPAEFIGYARRTIAGWAEEAANPSGDGQQNAAAPHAESFAVELELSVDELLKNNQLATAVERLEKDIREQPKNFDHWLKLAEVYAVYCADSNRAGKIIQKMENTSAFRAEEIQAAKQKLREWQKVRGV
jgi:tetratricopeptide (TPR) repeat protein